LHPFFTDLKKKTKNGKKTIKNKKLLKVIYQIVIDFSEKRENMCSFVIKKKNTFLHIVSKQAKIILLKIFILKLVLL
jgi:hypothetical protein